MSEVNGFPVPPGCDEFIQYDAEIHFCITEFTHGLGGRLLIAESLDSLPPGLIPVVQSCGYRAWMEEAEKAPCQSVRDMCIYNAERCRDWRPE